MEYTPQGLEQVLDEVSADTLMQHVTTIARWVRLSGTPAEAEAFAYIESVARGFGLEVTRYAPVCLVSLPLSASLVVVKSNESIPCITHSFSASTESGGIEAELVYVGNAREADYAATSARGRIALAEGLATPEKAVLAERHGVAGMIHISGEHLHEMIISPVWGSPTAETIHLLPTRPHVSIDRKAGDHLKRLLESGPVRVRLTTEVDTGWRPLPLLIADLPAPDGDGSFVLFSGHVDSWHYGAMDNGSANALMLEVARILSRHREDLRRSVRFAFWSGHSHARYATSTWYADHAWDELWERCVAHVNIDSPGAINATVLSEAPTMAETHDFAREVIRSLTGQELRYHRIGRLGDQSFWGTGIPSLFCSISEQGEAQEEGDIGALIGGSRARRGGLGWWWHTTEDTVDKIDPANLVRDTRVLLATVLGLATAPVLPFRQSRAVEEIRDALADLATVTGAELIGLAALRQECDLLLNAARRLDARCEQPVDAQTARRLNRCSMRVSRELIPVNYTARGPFEQDLALPTKPLPGLQRLHDLSRLQPADPGYYPLLHSLQRERNRVLHALRSARRHIEETLDTSA
ncbi:M28 family peptidase [Thermomicrobiaceae bacterium CFH 74404]|uniref:M28 family peptidase n=1 Tax=Thermalbibacter longus TaxID=2951981 RepID=A0AA41WG79_9BACT|nr:M28 family peptidase [Thermalbibacter longus]MCM8749815.1 M28 family peptidase [Thermalbibacter longus]